MWRGGAISSAMPLFEFSSTPTYTFTRIHDDVILARTEPSVLPIHSGHSNTFGDCLSLYEYHESGQGTQMPFYRPNLFSRHDGVGIPTEPLLVPTYSEVNHHEPMICRQSMYEITSNIVPLNTGQFRQSHHTSSIGNSDTITALAYEASNLYAIERHADNNDSRSIPRNSYLPFGYCETVNTAGEWPEPEVTSGRDVESPKRFKCLLCPKSYCRRSTLKAHLRSHSGERPYHCVTCGKTFAQAANLTAHSRVHTGEKPFVCSICFRPFSQSSSLVTHKRTHTGERPYQCKYCDKAFTDSSTLTKHLRTHNGNKPYECPICHLRFSQSGNLNRHRKTHTKKANDDEGGGVYLPQQCFFGESSEVWRHHDYYRH